MSIKSYVITGLLSLMMSTPALAAPHLGSAEDTIAKADRPIMLAQKRKKRRKGKGVRERIITREARGRLGKGSDKRNIDFDSVDIGGQRKTPMGSLVSQNKADKNYDFVKIRLRWHGEMVQSASSLEAGGN